MDLCLKRERFRFLWFIQKHIFNHHDFFLEKRLSISKQSITRGYRTGKNKKTGLCIRKQQKMFSANLFFFTEEEETVGACDVKICHSSPQKHVH